MFPEPTDFTVEIQDQRFTTGDGQKFRKKAILAFTTPEGHQEFIRELGYRGAEEIYQAIHKGESLNLDHSYIDHISLTDYREKFGLDKKEYVLIQNFSARHAFFDCKKPIELDHAEFSGDLVFSGSTIPRGEVNLHGSKISGGVDFSDAHLPDGSFNLSNLSVGDGDVNFKNAVFGTGKKDFQYADLGNGSKIFTNAEFGDGDVSFVNTLFGKGDVSFKVARFGNGKKDFHFAKFYEGNISFDQVDFGNGRVDFRTVEFSKGRVNFNRAVFGVGDVSFEASELKDGKMNFKRTQFGEGSLDFELAEYDDADLSFDRAVFNVGNVSFYNARIRTLSFHSCHFDHYLDLRVAKCRHINLSDTIIRDILDLKPYDFEIDIDTIDFSGMRLLGRIDIEWSANHVKQLIRQQKNTSNRLKAEQFRTLKENFNVTGKYNDEDKAYLEFKRLESITVLEESIRKRPISALWMYPAYSFKLVIFDWVGHYATNPVRVIISMLVMYAFFSGVFMLLTLFTPADIVSSVGDPDKLNVVVKSLYHCAITFLTIGYGDYYPSGAIRWFSSFVGFSGLVMVAYFTVAFVRKILR
jgi:hypothetical protein